MPPQYLHLLPQQRSYREKSPSISGSAADTVIGTLITTQKPSENIHWADRVLISAILKWHLNNFEADNLTSGVE